MLTKEVIPTAYLVMADRLYQDAKDGVISRKRAKYLMRLIYRMPKNSISPILKEMQDLGLLKLISQRTIVILWDDINF